MELSQGATLSAVVLVEPLLAAASSSSYWLAKVELLRTLACLPVTALALSLPSLPHSLLSVCVFPLLEDGDHRLIELLSPSFIQTLVFPQSENCGC